MNEDPKSAKELQRDTTAEWIVKKFATPQGPLGDDLMRGPDEHTKGRATISIEFTDLGAANAVYDKIEALLAVNGSCGLLSMETWFADDDAVPAQPVEADSALKWKRIADAGAENLREIWTALRMIQDAVQELGPVGAVRSLDVGPPNPIGEAEAIIEGIKKIVRQPREITSEMVHKAWRALPYNPRQEIDFHDMRDALEEAERAR